MQPFLLLSPHYPPRVFQFAPALRAAGFLPVAIGDAHWDGLRGELHQALGEYIHLPLHCYSARGAIDDERYEPIYRAVAGLIQRHGRLAGVESFNEFWLPLEARLREDFNIPGPRPAELEHLIRKSRMKDVFRKAGVTVVPGEVVRDLDHLKTFLRTEKTIIVKPDIGVGASDTHRIENPAEADAFWHQHDPSTTYYMERFISGDDRELLSFDGITDINGDIVFSVVHPCSDGLLEVVNGGVLSYHCLKQSEINLELRRIGTAAIRGFGLRRRFFHLEFFRVGKTYYGIEINARPPGVVTLDMNNHAFGTNLWAAWTRVWQGDTSPVPLSRDKICAYVARVNRFNYRYTHDEILQRFGSQIVFWSPMDGPVMGDMAYIIIADSHDERRNLIKEIIATV
jgi:hypothetical protein